ncbi:MAG: serine/threonine kinase [Enterobacter phage ENC31]|nr:MAG: serine/threonine kinase [Enterobacter phage ENC31]UIW12515.1 MAG: serine/threonine kinase [Enterobacter phage ENC2-2_a]
MNAHDKAIMNNLMSQLHAIICEECYKIEDSNAGIAGQPRWGAFEILAREHGYKLLGLGHFAAAFEHEDLPGYAIKVGFKKDDSGAAYAAFCRENEGLAGLPVIHLVKRFSRAYMVAMDKYHSLNDIGGNYCRDCETYEQRVLNVSWRVVNAIIDYCEQPSEALRWGLDQDARAEFAHDEAQYIKDLAQTAKKINSFFYGLASFDTHRANVMVDNNGRLIITDPVSWTASDHQDELQGKLNAIAE